MPIKNHKSTANYHFSIQQNMRNLAELKKNIIIKFHIELQFCIHFLY